MEGYAKKLWLNKIGEDHTNSEETEKMYDYVSNQFCDVMGTTLNKINEEWEKIEDSKDSFKAERKFKKKHHRLVEQYKLFLKEQRYAKSVRNSRIAIIQSFYNSLPELKIDFGIPKAEVEFHNRDITVEEITKILNQANPRDRAIYAIMAQGGLTPKNIVLLRYKEPLKACRFS